ncbi:MAG: PhnD/SsuA/transferrin family substrate-binding protein [Candidatus Thiodiazotropha sp. (ex Epidulcina cf. delphinae)]|nr:PhnD/SsuA/transferrin family substrate-binding protein [Candidatus Thiodiazotropha sp. (ex Epidulcina cf. delphinae)]
MHIRIDAQRTDKFSLRLLPILVALIVADCWTRAYAESLIIGLFPRRDAALTARLFHPLSRYLEEQLQLSVRLEMSADFDTFLSRLKERRYDLVHLNQFEYINAHDQLGYDALVQNEEFGEKTIKGAIYVRRDSGIQRLEQLRGKQILFGGGPRAMMSYIVPTYLLRQAGLAQGDYRESYATNPPNAVLATFLRQTDAGGAGEVVRRLPMITSKIDIDELNLIAISQPLPHLPWAVKREMPDELKSRIQDLLIGLKDSPQGRDTLQQAGLTAFNPAQDRDYDLHREIIDSVYAH